MSFLPPQLQKRLSERARGAIEKSLRLARQYPIQKERGISVDPLHLLYALSMSKGALAQTIIEMQKLSSRRILSLLKRKTSSAQKQKKANVPLCSISPPYRKILKRALVIAKEYGQAFVGTEHLLFALAQSASLPLSKHVCKRIREQLEDLFITSSHFPEIVPFAPTELFFAGQKENPHGAPNPLGHYAPSRIHRPAKSVLHTFCEDLAARAQKGETDPLVGREKEINRLINILLRRTKNNPLLIGEPGVGKTALVHGLAQKILAGDVPQPLLDKRVMSLNLSAFVAGTMFRGEFESRMRDLIREAAQDTSTILFIDEIHNIVGAGSAQGSLDAANMLKPSLTDGSIRCIGATTFEEYKKYIEKDRALERRFQPIFIREETPEQSLQTLKILRPLYEKYHKIRISDEALEAAVQLAVRYVHDRALPDKAIDLLDEAASTLSHAISRHPKARVLQRLERQEFMLTRKKEDMVRREKFEEALTMKNREMTVRKELDALRKTENAPQAILTAETIREVLGETTGIPLVTLEQDERKRFLRIEQELNGALVGQEKANRQVAATLRRNKAGIHEAHRPLASFLFIGPSGVGKTELAKILARILSPQNAETRIPPNLVTLDMSEYSEAHTISRLIGAPPGYVGYEEGGQLTNKIRVNPYSVVLFDEIEKAHPRIFNLLLQILDEGCLTDGNGKRVNFANTLIILTSNVGTESWFNAKSLGFASEKQEEMLTKQEERINERLKEYIRPEILNRIDRTVFFSPLNQGHLQKIARLQLLELKKRLAPSCSFSFEPRVAQWISRKCSKPEEGARGIRKIIADCVEAPIAEYILRENPETIHITIFKDGIACNVKTTHAPIPRKERIALAAVKYKRS